MAARNFLPGDLVLAKMKRFPPWPAKIVNPPRNHKASTQKKSHFVYFFGSDNYARIHDEQITPYSEVALQSFIQRKSRAYQEALKDFFKYAHGKQNPLKSKKQKNRNANKKYSNGKRQKVEDGSKRPPKDKSKNCNVRKCPSRKGKNGNAVQKQIRKKGRGSRPLKQEHGNDGKDPLQKPEKKGGSENGGKDPLQMPEKKDGSGNGGKDPLHKPEKKDGSQNGARDPPRMTETKKGRMHSTRKQGKKNEKIQNGAKHTTTPEQTQGNEKEEITCKNDDSWNDTYHSFIDILLSPSTKKDRKSIEPSKKKFGFIGLGNIGNAVVINLINSGHDVTVWNRSIHKCEKYIALGAKLAFSPANLVLACDVTFCCVSGPEASIEVVFGDQGVLKGLEQAEEFGLGLRGFVELTTIDPETSVRLKEAINMKRGLYLEVPIYGSRQKVERGESVVTATGDRRLYAQCETCFYSFARNAYYLNSDIGSALVMFLCQDGMFNSALVLLAEGLALAERLGLEKTILLDILCLCLQHKVMTFESLRRMRGRRFIPSMSGQKALALALHMADKEGQTMPVTLAVNEMIKLNRLSYTDISRE